LRKNLEAALLEVEELIGFDLGKWMRVRSKGAEAGLASVCTV
jgi:hypothetical protein